MYAEIELSKSSFVAAIATKKGPSSLSTDKGVPLTPSKEDLQLFWWVLKLVYVYIILPASAMRLGKRDTSLLHLLTINSRLKSRRLCTLTQPAQNVTLLVWKLTAVFISIDWHSQNTHTAGLESTWKPIGWNNDVMKS